MKIQNIFLENKAWVQEKLQTNSRYFEEMSKDQTPDFVWIGCSDSRVLPNEITGLSIGEIFVHRNIANLVHADDLNLMSVVTYAIDYLKIKHIIVCGHYGCGGIRAAMTTRSYGLLDGWLQNIKDVMQRYGSELERCSGEEQRFKRLVELNVIEQCELLKNSSVIAELSARNPGLQIHGWVYDLSTGYLSTHARITLSP